MNFLERDLERIIFETDNSILIDRGLDINGRKMRQVKIGNYGIADIITYKSDCNGQLLYINIYELKKQKIDANTLMQAYRYVKGIDRYFSKRKFMPVVEFSVTLIGREICMGDFIYLKDYLDNVNIYTYSYDFDGLSFEQPGSYFLIGEGF